MEKRYQIFVSSTFSDLVQERRAVMQALLSLDHFPAGMELFPASNEDQWALIKGVIDDSDYYILVIGGRYGSLSPERVSYTEKEFEYAASVGIPVLAFLHENPGEIPAKKTDENDALRGKLEAPREKVKLSRHVKFWSSPEDLQAKVILAVSAETKRNAREGWVRAGRAGDPSKLLALQEEIFRLQHELALARTAPPPGTELYEQGDDEFIIEYSYKPDGAREERDEEITLSWDQIFYEVGPVLMDEASENEMRRRLVKECPAYASDAMLAAQPWDASISNDSFDTIKIQLLVLGLISKSERKRAPSDRHSYWSLTPFGEQYLMQLRARRRGQEPGENSEIRLRRRRENSQ